MRTRTNRSGGVQGGISNGEEIVVRVAFKPTATILREQETVDESGHDTTIKAPRPPRSVRAAARGPDRRGDAGAGARRSLPAAARPVRVAPRWRCIALAAAAGCRGRAAELLGRFDASMPSMPAPPPPTRGAARGPLHATRRRTRSPSTGAATERRCATGPRIVPPRTVERAPGRRPPRPPSPGPFQEAVADGWSRALEYQYEVGHPMQPRAHAFRAPPAPGASGFIVRRGRRHRATTGGQPAAAGVHRASRLADPRSCWRSAISPTPTSRTQAAVDRHFDDVMVWSRRAAYMPAWGNHEWDDPQRDDLRNYKGRFALPHAAASPGAPGDRLLRRGLVLVRLRRGPLHHLPRALHARHLGRLGQAGRAAVRRGARPNPRIKFVVTAGHRPAYSSGHHGGDPQLRAILDGFGKRFRKYVLNLNGHSHVYERTKPQAHVVHITAGIGGGALEHAATPLPVGRLQAARRSPPSARSTTASSRSRCARRSCGSRRSAVRPSPGNEDISCGDGEIVDEVVIPAGGAVEPAPLRHQADQLFH